MIEPVQKLIDGEPEVERYIRIENKRMESEFSALIDTELGGHECKYHGEVFKRNSKGETCIFCYHFNNYIPIHKCTDCPVYKIKRPIRSNKDMIIDMFK